MAQKVTASYAVPQSSLMTILKELAKAKQTHCQQRKNPLLTHQKQGAALQPVVAKPGMPKMVPPKTHPSGKKTIWFIAKPATGNPTKTVTLVQKLLM